MTKRRIFAMIIALTLCFSLCACGTGTTSTTDSTDVSFGNFVVLEKGKIDNTDLYQYIMYDPETLVMYTFLDGYGCGGPTVMYNADGTLRIYSPEH